MKLYKIFYIWKTLLKQLKECRLWLEHFQFFLKQHSVDHSWTLRCRTLETCLYLYFPFCYISYLHFTSFGLAFQCKSVPSFQHDNSTTIWDVALHSESPSYIQTILTENRQEGLNIALQYIAWVCFLCFKLRYNPIYHVNKTVYVSNA